MRLTLFKQRRSDCYYQPCESVVLRKEGDVLNMPLNKRQKMSENVKVNELPEDILVEILVRLPVKSLVRFRCVCNSWFSLLTHPRFVRDHLKHDHEQHENHMRMEGVIQILVDSPFSSHWKEEEELEELEETEELELEGEEEEIDCSSILRDTNMFKVWGHCDGLLCGVVENLEVLALIVWNPSLREYIELSSSPHPTSPENRYMIHGIGYDTHSEDYKVVKIFQSQPYFMKPIKPEVYVLSLKANSWKRIPNTLSFSMSSHQGIHVNGSIYWIVEFPVSSILCFDLVEEKISLVDLPVKKHWFECKLMNMQGSLCLSVFGADQLSTRVFSLSPKDKDGTDRVWIKLFTISTSCFLETYGPPDLTWNFEFLLKWSPRNVRKVSWSCDLRYLSSEAFHYKESLVSPHRLVCYPS